MMDKKWTEELTKCINKISDRLRKEPNKGQAEYIKTCIPEPVILDMMNNWSEEQWLGFIELIL